MMRRLNLLLVFYVSCLITSCDQHENKLEVRDYFAEGTADPNHLEKGLWKFYELKKHNLCQEGNFLNGVRVGSWKYYLPFIDTIVWVQYYSKDSFTRTNIPSYLTIDTDVGNFIAFKHKDTSKVLLLKIAYDKNPVFDVADYNKEMLREVKINSSKIVYTAYTPIITTCNRVYHFNKFTGIDKENRNYTLFSINSVLSDSLLIEVTVRCNTENINLGEETFFSIISNLYIGRNRFFDMNIDCEIIRNEDIKSNRSFSFSCNDRPSK